MKKNVSERSGAKTVRQLEVAMFFFSAPKFVERVLIRFVDVAKVIAERSYLFAHELLDSIPFQESVMAFVYLEQLDYFISLLWCLIMKCNFYNPLK